MSALVLVLVPVPAPALTLTFSPIPPDFYIGLSDTIPSTLRCRSSHSDPAVVAPVSRPLRSPTSPSLAACISPVHHARLFLQLQPERAKRPTANAPRHAAFYAPKRWLYPLRAHGARLTAAPHPRPRMKHLFHGKNFMAMSRTSWTSMRCLLLGSCSRPPSVGFVGALCNDSGGANPVLLGATSLCIWKPSTWPPLIFSRGRVPPQLASHPAIATELLVPRLLCRERGSTICRLCEWFDCCRMTESLTYRQILWPISIA